MSTANSDALPPEVQAEVDAIRNGEGADEEPQAAPEQEEERVPLTRRQRKEQERQDEIKSAREAADAARTMAENAQRQAEEDRAARAQLERQMIELTTIARMSQQPQGQTTPTNDAEGWRDRYDKQLKKAKEALTAGNIDEYQERTMKAAEIRARAAIQPTIPDPRQFQQPAQQQQFQKPAWVQVVENEYPDVVTHDRGFDTVASFMRISGVQPHAVNADALRKAFGRAREELGTKQRQEQQIANKRQIMAGGSSPGRAAGGTGGGKGGTTVSLKGFPQGFDYRGAARRAGMSPEDYVRAYAKMNPGDVEKA
jgi:hypothetical protein